MSLTLGTGPFSSERTGHLDFEPPRHVVLVQPFPRRVRGVKRGRTLVDSDAVLLVHETGKLPRYSFPSADVDVDAEPDPCADGHVVVRWDAVDAWYEEDERVQVHPRDPYHRIDTFATSRRVDVALDGTVLASSARTVALYETGLPVRWYFPPADVRLPLLAASVKTTECPYKGTAHQWDARVGDAAVEDVAWTYDRPLREAAAVEGLIAFYDGKVDVDVDG